MYTIDQQNTGSQQHGGAIGYNSSQQQFAIPFTPSHDNVSKVIIPFFKAGSPTGNIWAEIWSNSSGSPGSQTGNDSATVAANTITPTGNPGQDVEFIFSTPVSVTPSTLYWIVINFDYSLTTSNYIGISSTETAYQAVMKYYNGSGWTADSYYGVFKEYYYTSSPSSSLSSSPSSSLSSSSSLSLSASSSSSLSSSISSSFSASQSPSSSSSASPSPGYTGFTRGNYVSLPGNDTDLEDTYSGADVTKVATKDDQRVGQTGLGQYMIHQFKNFLGSQTFCHLEAEVQSTQAPSVSTIYLQIYNRNSTSWETVASNNSANADTDFTLSADIADLTNYKDGDNVISCRIYQQAI
jgi:hypothetical protein